MNTIVVNDIIESFNGPISVKYRVVAFSASQRVILFELPPPESRATSPAIKLTSNGTKEIADLISDGTVHVLDHDPFLPRVVSPATASDDEMDVQSCDENRQDHAYNVVSWIVADGYETLLTKHGRATRIGTAADQFQQHPKTLSRWLARFLTYGMTPSSLYVFHHKKGWRGRRQTEGKVKRGAPTRFHIGGGCNVSPEIRDKIQKYSRMELLKGKPTLKELHLGFCNRYFVDGVEQKPNGTERRVLLPKESKISFPTFKKYYYKDRNPIELSQLLHGTKHDLNFREKVGSETARSLFAGEYLQIDFTIWDVELVHPIYRYPIGRGLGGLGCDVFSTYQAGMRLSMANPCAQEAMLLLENIFSDKVEFCRRLGLKIKSEDWLGGFLWSNVVGDNGELRGKRAKLIAKNLKVDFTNTAPYRADQKGSIESAFSYLTKQHIRLLPGYTPRRRERGDKKCGLDAKLDPLALAKIIARCCMHRNGVWIEKHHLTFQAERDGVNPRPGEIFQHSIRTNSGALRRAPAPDVLRFMLLDRAKAKIEDKGIVFRGLYYTNDLIHQSGAYVRARKSGKDYIDIAFASDLVDAIYLIPSPGDPALLPCHLGPRSQKYSGHGLSFEDVETIESDQSLRQVESEDRDQQSNLDFKAEIDGIIEEQKDRNNFAKGTTRTFGIPNKSDARSAAAKEGARADARVLLPPETPSKKILLFPEGGTLPTTNPAPPPLPDKTTTDARDQKLGKLYGEL